MFAKLVVVIVTIGACACTLLSLRQLRLQTAHELTRAQLRVRECDDHLWALRAEIGRRVMPDRVRQMADALGSFRPMLPLPGDAQHREDYADATASERLPITRRAADRPEVLPVSHVSFADKPAGTKPGAGKPPARPASHVSNTPREPRQ